MNTNLGPNAGASFEGKLTPTRQSLEGTWSQGGVKIPITFRREAPGIAGRKSDDGGLQSWAKVLLEHMRGAKKEKSHDSSLPLDIRATAFQRRVWTYLQKIPFGATRSYSQVAEAIGRPTAARAVARACATNPVAVAIPCHRVVREDGSMGGYRWGIERKKALLEMEQA